MLATLQDQTDLTYSYLVLSFESGLGQRTCIEDESMIWWCSFVVIFVPPEQYKKPAELIHRRGRNKEILYAVCCFWFSSAYAYRQQAVAGLCCMHEAQSSKWCAVEVSCSKQISCIFTPSCRLASFHPFLTSHLPIPARYPQFVLPYLFRIRGIET